MEPQTEPLRRGAVRAEHFADKADAVRELGLGRDDGLERTLGERAVADLAAAGAADAARLADGVRREVIMMDITLGILVIDGVERLEVADGAKRHGCKHLGLAAGERPEPWVRGRTPTSAANGRTSSSAAVDTLAFEQPAADDLLLQFIEAVVDERVAVRVLLGKVSLDVLGQRGKARVADGLIVRVHAVLHFSVA